MSLDWWSLGFQAVNFLVIVWLLSRFLYKPVRKVIADREAADAAAAEAARVAREEAAGVKAEYEAKLAQMQQDLVAREAELHAQMEAERKALLDKAKAEADATLAATRDKLAGERDQAMTTLEADIAGLAAEIAKKALTGMSGRDDVLAHLDAMEPGARADLAADGALDVVTVGALDDAARKAWTQALRERLGEGVTIGFDEDASILGGVELRFAHGKMSFTVADRLEQAAKAAKG